MSNPDTHSRWLRIKQGELLYFKEEDLVNPLNIIPLTSNTVSFVKKGTDGFTVVTAKKQFHFRVPVSAYVVFLLFHADCPVLVSETRPQRLSVMLGLPC
jgi:hypothetical protein